MRLPNRLFINCFPGITPWLRKEVEQLGYTVVSEERTGLYVKGNFQDTYRLNFFLRTANKVLFEIASFQASTPDQLYRKLVGIPWEEILNPRGYVSIGGFVRNDHIRDNRFAFMKVKDAVVDRMQEKTGSRPDSGPRTNKSVLFLHWTGSDVTISIDTSGDTLARHGYRKNPGKAPMAEPLAAAVLMATRWDRKSPLVNPMCGSGTLVIEAALMLQHTFPGHFRTNYGFMHTQWFDSLNWQKVKREGDQQRRLKDSGFPPLIASDHDEQALRAARGNAREAGVDHLIDFQLCDFRETSLPITEDGILLLNPEYGERLGEADKLREVYRGIGDFFKQRGAGYTGYIFTGNLDLAKSVGLRTSRRTEYFNARIESRLLEYELYKGSRKS